jgi:hypothetical protein
MAFGSFLFPVLPTLLLAQAAPPSPAVEFPVALDPASIVEQLRETRLRPLEAVRASGQTIDLALGRLALNRGVVIPTSPLEEACRELVFVGEGRLVVELDDPVETAQLELFTGRSSLDIPVERAVLVLGDAAAAAAILEWGEAVDPDAAVVERAEKMFGHWTGRARRRGFGAAHALFRAAVGDPLGLGYVGVWGNSTEIGDFYARIDPSRPEPSAMGSFSIFERELAEEEKEEREADAVERPRKNLGNDRRTEWEVSVKIWVSTIPPRTGDGPPLSAGVEPESYAIELDLEGDDLAARGETRMRLRPEISGLRTVSLSLMEQVEVEEVRDGEGRDLGWHRIGRSVHILLHEPTERGRTMELTVRHRGEPLQQLNSFSFALRDTSGWYPHAGWLDRAVYDLTFRWPEGLRLLASGELLEQGVEEGRQWQRRRLDVAANHVSFEVGRFDVVTEEVGHIELTVAFNKIRGKVEPESKRQTVAALKGALLYYESLFGSLPVDHLTVVTVERGFSQGFLGFLTLSHSLFDWHHGQTGRLETLAHEMSHQWWGNLVGWAGYRDQWLSEALADYSAVLFMRRIATREPVYLAGHARGWRVALGQRNHEGRRFASLGPVVLGRRLGLNHSPAAYQAIVYDKGSVVFSMLARRLGQEPLQQMLRTLVDVVDNRVISTETFLKALEKMSGEDLHPFAWQYIFGTTYPDVHYECAARRRDAGGWLIEGTARLVAEGDVRFRALRREPKGWDVVREPLRTIDLADWSMRVPFQVASADDSAGAEEPTVAGFGGEIELRGDTTRFSIPLDSEPGEFWLDQRGEVLAEFFCDTRHPKSGLRRRAEILSRNGRAEEAEMLFRRALQAPLRGGAVSDDGFTREVLEQEVRLQDAAALIGLARIHLDRDSDDAASAALTRVEKLAGEEDEFFLGERIVLLSRLDLRARRYAPAYHRLYDYLAAHPDGLSALERTKFGATTWIVDEVEAIALLAVAATKTKRWEVAEWAIKAAEWLGADMSALNSGNGKD